MIALIQSRVSFHGIFFFHLIVVFKYFYHNTVLNTRNQRTAYYQETNHADQKDGGRPVYRQQKRQNRRKPDQYRFGQLPDSHQQSILQIFPNGIVIPALDLEDVQQCKQI